MERFGSSIARIFQSTPKEPESADEYFTDPEDDVFKSPQPNSAQQTEFVYETPESGVTYRADRALPSGSRRYDSSAESSNQGTPVTESPISPVTGRRRRVRLNPDREIASQARDLNIDLNTGVRTRAQSTRQAQPRNILKRRSKSQR